MALAAVDLSLNMLVDQQVLISKVFDELRRWSNKYGTEAAGVALAIASIALVYRFAKGKEPSRLEEALEIFEMKDISEFTKKSFNWIYLCKKKQFTTSRGLGNSLAGHFYEEKLRRLEEARAIIENEVKKKEGLIEEREIQACK